MSKLGDEDQVLKARRKTRMQEVGIAHEHLTLKDSLIFSRRRGGIEGENQVRRRESECDHEILISRMRNSRKREEELSKPIRRSRCQISCQRNKKEG